MNRHIPLVGLLVLVVVTGAGCSTAPSKESGQPPDQPYYERSRMMIDDVDAPLEVNDPWEGMNRSIYRFNSYADRYVLNPAVSAYRFVFPGFVRKGISNFFVNLDNIQTVINEIFQLHPGSAIQTTGRFLVNTTIGIVGLCDSPRRSVFRSTTKTSDKRSAAGASAPGPYLVLPLFGPSFVRDAGGRLVDAEIFTADRSAATRRRQRGLHLPLLHVAGAQHAQHHVVPVLPDRFAVRIRAGPARCGPRSAS